MKKHSGESSGLKPSNPQLVHTAAKPRVRYEGFESIKDGRRLRFSVTSINHGSIEITLEIPDDVFVGVPGISIQDAAPMVYEKIVNLLAKREMIDSSDLCLTDADMRQYVAVHLSRQKRRYWSDGRRRSDIAV